MTSRNTTELPSLLYPGEPIPPEYQFLPDDPDDAIIEQRVFAEFNNQVFNRDWSDLTQSTRSSLESFRAPVSTPLDEGYQNEPTQIPSNIPVSGIASLSLEPALSARSNTGVVDFSLPSAAPAEPSQVPVPDDSSDEESLRPIINVTTDLQPIFSEMTPFNPNPIDPANVRLVSPNFTSVRNESKVIRLKAEVQNLARNKRCLKDSLKDEYSRTEQLRVKLLQQIKEYLEEEEKLYQLSNQLEKTQTEIIRHRDAQYWEGIATMERQHRVEAARLRDQCMSSEENLQSSADHQRLAQECSDLTQELKDMNKRYSLTWGFQDDLLDDVLRRFERGADTILSLKSGLAQSNMKIREECAELELILRGERRSMKHQYTKTQSKHASETRVLEQEKQTLCEELAALKSSLLDAQMGLQERDALIATLEEQRAHVEMRVAEESDDYLDLINEDTSVNLADLQQKQASLIASIERKDRELNNERILAKILRADIRQHQNSEFSRHVPGPRPATPTPYSEARKSVRILQKSATVPSTPSQQGLQSPPTTTPSGEQRKFLLGRIREAMNALLGIKYDKDIVAAVRNGRGLTEEEHAASEAHAATNIIEDMHTSNLRPFWRDINCEYNRFLAIMFTYDFLKKNPSYRPDKEIIVDHFLKRLQRLKNFLI